MNKKGKNKKKTISTDDKIEEKQEDVIGISDKDDRVPEVVSEAPLQVKDEEAPKKPKRNRGKKKKGTEDDVSKKNLEEIDLPPVEVIEEKPFETVVPAARKKKNKKKGIEHINELPEEIEKDTKESVQELPKPEVPEVIEDVKPLPEQEVKDVIEKEPQEQEIKPSKKKNKKKKRNDSERSDKEEVSCTSAFDKLLEATEAEEKIEEKGTRQEPLVDIPLHTDIQTLKDTKVEIPKSVTPTIPLEKSNDEKDVKEVSKPENKNKKKNKKDKRQVQGKLDTPTPEPTIEQVDDKPTVLEIPTEIVKQENKPIEEIETVVKESSPKPKAKIAKPVEKKRKEKHETTDNMETVDNVTKPEETVETKYSATPKEISEEPIIEVIDILDIPFTFQHTKADQPLEELNIPDTAMGKKRKKTPKNTKQSEPEAEAQKINIESDMKPTDLKEQATSTVNPIIIESEEQKHMQPKEESSTEFNRERHTTPTKPDIELTVEDTTKLLPEPEEVKSSDFAETKLLTEDTQSKQKSGKRRKKSPKLPINPEEIKTQPPVTEPVYVRETAKEPESEILNTKENKKAENNKSKSDTNTERPKLDEIEIRSLKTDESEGSTCDVTPDILYPRASSQQLLDSNNNTLIRELIATDSVLDMPTVLGHVDVPKTPEPTPEKTIASDNTTTDTCKEPISEHKDTISSSTKSPKHIKAERKQKQSKHKDEKTDIKSKMMEVNQDMEELRLSIEKSLAELTAIEKNEETIEKKFEEAITGAVISIGESSEVKTDTPMNLETKLDELVPDKATTSSTDKDKCESEMRIESEHVTDICNVNVFVPSDIKTTELPKIEDIIESALIKDKPITTSSEPQSIEEAPSKAVETICPLIEEKDIQKEKESKPQEQPCSTETPPVCPARKDHKGKHKKKKGKQDSQTPQTSTTTASSSTSNTPTTTESKETKDSKKDEKSESKSDNKEKGKQQADAENTEIDYEPIENFEDALTSSVDDVNKSFEMIVNEANEQTNPKINIIAPDDDKTNKIQPPKNLLGHPDIPVQSSKRDYKKEKNKSPNESQAKVKIKDSVVVEKTSKNTQTANKIVKNDIKLDNEYVYKYSFRKVFLQSACHVCKRDLSQRVPCGYCKLIFYCSSKHKDEDWPQHQGFCFAVSTIVHLKDQKYIYADTQNVSGHDYRLIRMQMIVSCEKVLKRRLMPCEQEALLYPRVCAFTSCREWRQGNLKDCEGCGQISYCSDNPDHLPKTHQRWCKSYSLYQKLVCYQQTQGRLEPKLPSKVVEESYQIPEKINEVLASMYEEKIDMNDIQYAALTQIATAPLTAAYSHQVHKNKMNTANGVAKKSSFTIHVVGAELQFEADALDKWEVFFLHLRPDLQELRVVLLNSNLNPSNLPLDLLGKIKLCDNCRQKKRRVIFYFQDKRSYAEYRSSEDFVHPDLICTFNPSIQRSSIYNGKDSWPSTINTIIKLKTPWLVTGYTISELQRDTVRIKECSEIPYNVVLEPKYNIFASVRPDRNFISDDEMPLLFKNYCLTVICG